MLIIFYLKNYLRKKGGNDESQTLLDLDWQLMKCVRQAIFTFISEVVETNNRGRSAI